MRPRPNQGRGDMIAGCLLWPRTTLSGGECAGAQLEEADALLRRRSRELGLKS